MDFSMDAHLLDSIDSKGSTLKKERFEKKYRKIYIVKLEQTLFS